MEIRFFKNKFGKAIYEDKNHILFIFISIAD
jgi:hypothetical protein